MWPKIQRIDRRLRAFFQRADDHFPRIAIAIIYIWFGVIKLLGLSPATPLVFALYQKMTDLTIIPFDVFYPAFAGFEVLIGILILRPRAERIVLPLLAIHMLTTALPLFLVPEVAWQAFLVPTLEGQYIIKNLVIIAAAINIAAGLKKIQKIS